jgi:hypothetical protein
MLFSGHSFSYVSLYRRNRYKQHPRTLDMGADGARLRPARRRGLLDAAAKRRHRWLNALQFTREEAPESRGGDDVLYIPQHADLRGFAAAPRDFKPRLSTGVSMYHMDYTRRV